MPPELNQIPRVRTFEQDVAESMQSKQASVLHVALAEQDRVKEVSLENKKGRGNTLIYFFSFLFIIGAFGVAGYGYFFYTPTPNATLPKELVDAKNLIISDEVLSVQVDLKNRNASLALLSATSSLETTLGTVTHVVPYITETGSDGIEKNRTITSQEFFALLGSTVPDIFKRSLTNGISFVRVIDQGIHAGIIVQTNDYERTIVGLTSWEKTIVSDFEKVFGYTRKREVRELIETITDQEIVETVEEYDQKTKKVRLVTSTTTEPISTFEERVTYINDTVSFTNAIRKNIELRIAKGVSEKEYIVYGFPRRNTLIIADTTEAFLRIADRLPKEN